MRTLFVLTSLLLFGSIFGCASNTADQCEQSALCTQQGRCFAKQGLCVAATIAKCRQSLYCKTIGHCTLHNERCIAASVEDCIGSIQCHDRGICTPFAGECVPITDNDCKARTDCRVRGLCHVDPERHICIAANDADCKQSENCKQLGECTHDQIRCTKPYEPSKRESSNTETSTPDAGSEPPEGTTQTEGTPPEQALEASPDTAPTTLSLFSACSTLTQPCASGLACVLGRCMQLCSPKPNDQNTGCSIEQTCRLLGGKNICLDRCDILSGSLVGAGCPRGFFCDVKNQLAPTSPRYRCSPLPSASKGTRTAGQSCSDKPGELCDGSKTLFCDEQSKTCKQGCDPTTHVYPPKECKQDQRCAEDPQSPTGGRCESKLAPTEGELCNKSATTPCASGLVCTDFNVCAKTCTQGSDCNLGFGCYKWGNQLVCATSPRGDIDEKCSDLELCKPGLICVAMGASFTCQQPCDPQNPGGCGAADCRTLPRTKPISICIKSGTRKQGETCGKGVGDCEKGLTCLDHGKNEFNITWACRRECNSKTTGTCPQGYICRVGPKSAKPLLTAEVCYQNVQMGATCLGLTLACGDTCIEDLDGTNACLRVCDITKTSPCPQGWECSPEKQASEAYCQRAQKAVGEVCSVVRAGCVKGAYCTQDRFGFSCKKACSTLQSGGCPTGQSCVSQLGNAGACINDIQKTRTLHETCLDRDPTKASKDDCKSPYLCDGEQIGICHQACDSQNPNCPSGYTCIKDPYDRGDRCLQDCNQDSDCTDYVSVCASAGQYDVCAN